MRDEIEIYSDIENIKKYYRQTIENIEHLVNGCMMPRKQKEIVMMNMIESFHAYLQTAVEKNALIRFIDSKDLGEEAEKYINESELYNSVMNMLEDEELALEDIPQSIA